MKEKGRTSSEACGCQAKRKRLDAASGKVKPVQGAWKAKGVGRDRRRQQRGAVNGQPQEVETLSGFSASFFLPWSGLHPSNHDGGHDHHCATLAFFFVRLDASGERHVFVLRQEPERHHPRCHCWQLGPRQQVGTPALLLWATCRYRATFTRSSRSRGRHERICSCIRPSIHAELRQTARFVCRPWLALEFHNVVLFVSSPCPAARLLRVSDALKLAREVDPEVRRKATSVERVEVWAGVMDHGSKKSPPVAHEQGNSSGRRKRGQIGAHKRRPKGDGFVSPCL